MKGMPFHFEEIPSTQVFLKELVESGQTLPHLDFALADLQTDGLGRHGRSWISERGNLFLSIWLKGHQLPLTWIPHWVGTALIDSLAMLGLETDRLSLKWPNDLMIDRSRKTAGILCEKVGEGVIAGIGVNLISAPSFSDRDTGSIQMLNSDFNFQGFHLKLATLPELQKNYDQKSLLKAGQSLSWVDLHTQVKGSGTFLRYGNYGELVVRDHGGERALFSEEIKVTL
jgi:biotin-[acetyl-CoA-carboxylase] ligase BirA-like protein